MPQVDLQGLRHCFFYAEEIKTLKLQVVQLRTHLKSKADEVEQYKVCVAYIVCVHSTIMLICKDIHAHFFLRTSTAQSRNSCCNVVPGHKSITHA